MRPGPARCVAALITLPVAVAGVSLSRQVLSQHYAGQASDRWRPATRRPRSRPPTARCVSTARTMSVYYTKAAAFARLGDADAAEQTLLAATRIEPGDFLPYALLGDLSVRRRRLRSRPRTTIEKSAARNPREPALVQLVKNPRAAAPE